LVLGQGLTQVQARGVLVQTQQIGSRGATQERICAWLNDLDGRRRWLARERFGLGRRSARARRRSARWSVGSRQDSALVAALGLDQLAAQTLQQKLLAVLMHQRWWGGGRRSGGGGRGGRARQRRRGGVVAELHLLQHGQLGLAHQRHLTVHLGTHPRMLLDLDNGDALARVLVEDAHQQIGTAGLDPDRPLGLLLAQDGLDRWQLVLGMVAVDAPERILAGLHHVQHDTETPDIEFGAVENGAVCGRIDLQAHGAKVRLRIEAERVQVARKGLGSRVVQGSRTRENTAFVLVVVASKAEIAELDVVAIIDKDVVGFQIYNREMTQVR
jgi:hypothetical protein